MRTDETFIENCAHEFFNGFTLSGFPNYSIYTFGSFVEKRKKELSWTIQ